LALKSFGALQISTSYTDDLGTSYSETFNLTLQVTKKSTSGSASPTRTPTPAPRPILLIDGYQVDVDPLKAGSIFNLELRVTNVGGSEARSVTLIIGGGTVSTGASGTPGAETGGVSSSGGLEQFAPLGESNVAYLGNLTPGAQLTSIRADRQQHDRARGLPVKISLIYGDRPGKTYTDDQSITARHAPPMLEIGFYQPAGPFFAGQPGMLPIQVLNLDRKPVVLSRVRVLSDGAEITNGELPIGYLDTGLSFTIDAQALAYGPGPLPILVSVDYVDDFNEQQVIQQELTVDVLEAEPIPEDFGGGGGGGGAVFEPEVAQPESFWDKCCASCAACWADRPRPKRSIEEFPSKVRSSRARWRNEGIVVGGQWSVADVIAAGGAVWRSLGHCHVAHRRNAPPLITLPLITVRASDRLLQLVGATSAAAKDGAPRPSA
jgi:hypothetical protein